MQHINGYRRYKPTHKERIEKAINENYKVGETINSHDLRSKITTARGKEVMGSRELASRLTTISMVKRIKDCNYMRVA